MLWPLLVSYVTRRARAFAHYGKISIAVSVMALLVTGTDHLKRVTAGSEKAQYPGDTIHAGSLHNGAERRSAPARNGMKSLPVLASYAGPRPARTALEQNLARPLALASADFDEDGVPDLVSGYAGPEGGILALYRGNVDSIYPHSPEANLRRQGAAADERPSPFLGTSPVFDLPVAPDFVGAGDFNADGHFDLVFAARGGNKLYLLAGNGRGAFDAAEEIALPARVTALTTGEINRADGLADIVVGVADGTAAKVLVFEGPEGAWRAQPEIFSLPAAASDLSLGLLDGDPMFDLAMAVGSELMIVHGRDRKLTLGPAQGAAVPAAKVSHYAVSSAIKSLAVGHFSGGSLRQIGALCDDGSVRIVWATVDGWDGESLSDALHPRAGRLIGAQVYGGQVDDLVITDAESRQVKVLSRQKGGKSISLGVEDAPVAALPMRLNGDALSDLVLLTQGRSAPTVIASQPTAVFTVDSTENWPDSKPGDGVCVALPPVGVTPPQQPVCTLTAALMEANALPGPDTINFKITTGASPVKVINTTGLPPIDDTVTIDGRTQPGFTDTPLIEIISMFGLQIDPSGGGSSIRGLVVSGSVYSAGITIFGSSNNIVEGCYIGPNPVSESQGNYGIGILIDGQTPFASFANPDQIVASNNTIGGTVTAARNIISSNYSAGVQIDADLGPVGFFTEAPNAPSSATGNKVLGNFIGTDPSGAAAHANANGVTVRAATNNTVGGTTAGARNIISGNGQAGVRLESNADSNFVQGNFIGTDGTGLLALGNVGTGIEILGSSNNMIGGTTIQARNIICDNHKDGISITGSFGTGNTVQGNSIGVRLPNPGSANLPNFGNGVTISSSNTLVGGTVAETRNLILFNVGGGVVVQSGTGNSILGNEINRNGGLGIDLLPIGITPNDPGDPDTGPNNLQNIPILNSAVSDRNGFTVKGSLNSTPLTTFRIEFFSLASNLCNSSGNGSGGGFDGATTVTTDSSGNVNFTALFSIGFSEGLSVVATATDPAGNTSEFSPCLTVQVPKADLSVTMHDSAVAVYAGSPLTYTITVQNLGPDLATNVVVRDTLPAGVTFSSVTTSIGTCTAPPVGSTGTIICSLGSLTPSPPTPVGKQQIPQQATITLVVTPTVAAAAITNYAFVTANENDPNFSNNTAAQTETVFALADLVVTKTDAPDPVVAGSNLTYTITVTNNGPGAASNVVVTDTLTGGQVVPVSASTTAPNGVCAPTSNTGVTCTLGALNAGASVSATLVVRPLTPGTLTNTVTVKSAELDPNTNNNTAIATTTVLPLADLAVIMTDSPDPVPVNNLLTYSIKVTNLPIPSFSTNVTNVILTDTLPAGVTLSSAGATQGTCGGIVGGKITCNLGTINVGTSVTVTIIVNVLPTTTGTLSNTASVQADGSDPNPANNTATATTVVTSVANLVLTKTTTTLLPGPGDELRYTLKVDNTGPSAATGVTLTDPLPANTVFKSLTDVPGWTCNKPAAGSSGTVSCTAATFANGASATFTLVLTVGNNVAKDTVITNTAQVASAAFDGDQSNNTSSAAARVGAPQTRIVTGGTIDVGPVTVLPAPAQNPAGGNFVLENTGNATLFLTPVSLLRVAPNTDKLASPDDRSLFDVRVVTSGRETPLIYTSNGVITVLPGQQANFHAVFNPIIPIRACRTSGLAANQAVPDTINSQLTLMTQTGVPVMINLVGRTSTAAKLVHPLDPRRPAQVTLTGSGNNVKVEFWVYDPNMDIYLARYQFLDSAGNPVGLPVDVDLAQDIAAAGLARGQIFGVEQSFDTGTSVSNVRVTIFDRDNNNDSALSGPGGPTDCSIGTVSAASFADFGLSAESIVAGFGGGLAGAVQTAGSNPLPTTLAGTSIKIRDGAGVERLAPLFFVSPSQINYLIPADSSPGAATVTVTGGDNLLAMGTVRIADTGPGLFAANGNGAGVAAAVALRINADGTQSYEPVARFDPALGQSVAVPINPGDPSDQVYLIFYGTGIRNHGAFDSVKVWIGGVEAPVLYAGPQGEYAGLDQINVLLPRALSGRGDADVVLAVGNAVANRVQVNIGGSANLSGKAAALTLVEMPTQPPAPPTPQAIIVMRPIKLALQPAHAQR